MPLQNSIHVCDDDIRSMAGKSLLGGFHLGRPQKFRIILPTPSANSCNQLRLLTMSALEGTPLPPLCGRPKWNPPMKE